MASGDDHRIPSHDNDDEGGQNTILKPVSCLEPLPEQCHYDNFDFDTSDDDLPRTIGLHGLPKRVRVQIWKHLDWQCIKALSQTCSKFRSDVYATFERFIDIMPYIPLNHYLDATTRDTLRLVCVGLKTMMDLYDERDRNYCRWGSSTSLASCGFDNFYLPKGSNTNTLTHIFDLPVQDLKRIFSYLEEFDLRSLGNASQVFMRIVDNLKVYPFEEFRESYTLQLMDLPFEVHHKVLTFCNSTDRQRLRLVSKLMQFQVDMVGVEVHLNDLKWRSNRCGKLPPAYSLVITNVECTQSVNYFTAEDNCNLLTRIVVDGKYPAKAMIRVLERCKNLRFVGFTHALQMSSIEDELNKSFPVKRIPMELPSLRAIDLKIQEVDSPSSNIFRVHSWTWANAFEFMKPNLFRIPRLASFYICEEAIITHNLMYEVAEKVLKFIMEHRKSLKYVSVILNGNCLRTCGCPPFPFKIPDNVLKEIKLAKFCHDCDWRISRPFASILSMQRSLKELVCFKLSDWEFYAGIIAQNKCSLQSVTIEKNLAPVIDLSAFSACINLKRLWISQYSSSIQSQPTYRCHFQTVRVDQRLTNLHTLPLNITHLHILDQTVEAAQIQTIPQRLKKLEVLDLQFLGSWNGKSFGMSTETVKDILHLRNLKCLFLEEMRTLDAHMEDTLETALSGINLIPIQYSQLIRSVGCIINGILVADHLPDSSFMPEWQSRVACYLENVVSHSDQFANYEFRLEEEEEEDEELYEEDEEDEVEGFQGQNED